MPRTFTSDIIIGMKNIAIITGASSGMGKVFASQVAQKYDFDEIWIVARRLENLDQIARDINQNNHFEVVKPVQLDLSDVAGVRKLEKILSQENNRLENVLWGYRRGRFEVSLWTSNNVKYTRSVSERIKEIKGGIRDDVSPNIKVVILEWGVGREPYSEQVYKKETLDFDR